MTAVDGTWNITVISPIGEQTSVLALHVDGEALSGTITGAGGTSNLKDARVIEGVASWVTEITNPMPLTLEFSGRVEGDAISGTVKLGAFGNAPFSGRRV